MKKVILSMAVLFSVTLFGCAAPAEPETETAETAPAAQFKGDYIVDAAYVKENLDKIILVDARGDEAAGKGTIKGAVPLMWQYIATCEDGAPGDEMWGCILDPKRLSERLSEKGLDPEKEIVLFAAAEQGWGDDGRIAWELIAAGYKNVKMVDGGYAALESAGLETQKGGETPKPCDVTIDSIDETHVINTADLKSGYEGFKVVDVRADDEYNGKTLYGEAKGGHLPNAVQIRFTDLFNTDSKLKSNDELTKMFEDAGLAKDDQIVTYCTAGIRSAYMQLVMGMCGFDNVKNYDESFYRWCNVEDVE